MSSICYGAEYDVEHWRDGKLIDVLSCKNQATEEGTKELLDVAFLEATPPTQWYIGLIGNTGFSSLSTTDTMGAHAGWLEFTAYTQLNRPATERVKVITAGGSTGKPGVSSIMSGSPITNVIRITPDTFLLRGYFLTTGAVKGAGAGILLSTGVLAAGREIWPNDELFPRIRWNTTSDISDE